MRDDLNGGALVGFREIGKNDALLTRPARPEFASLRVSG